MTNVRLSRIESCVLALALLVALGFFVHQWLFPSSLYDAGQYARMARDIVDRGLRASASALRTYSYPVLLSFVYRGARLTGLPFPVLLFVLQLFLYVGACLFFRQALSRALPRAAPIAFCGMLGNYYILLYTSETLTESLSVSLLVIVGGCWLEAYRKHGSIWPVIVGSLVAGSSVVVRPANLFIVVAWIVGMAVIGWRQRLRPARALMLGVCVVAAVTLPLLPQLAYNVLRFGRWTPLVAENLGKMQQVWGIRDIKYATAMPPIAEPRIHYANPFTAGTTIDDAAPWRWYVGYPVRGALTLAVHTFNLTDQDLLFTYSRDLDPWYRLPLGVINHGIVALGLAGLLLAAREVRAAESPGPGDGYIMLLVTAGGSWAVHVLTAVEMRFGLTLLLVLTPMAAYALMQLVVERNSRRIVAVSASVTAYVVLALLLSGWVRDQAPMIRAARAKPSSRSGFVLMNVSAQAPPAPPVSTAGSLR